MFHLKTQNYRKLSRMTMENYLQFKILLANQERIWTKQINLNNPMTEKIYILWISFSEVTLWCIPTKWGVNQERIGDSGSWKAWLQASWWLCSLENDLSRYQMEYRWPLKGKGQDKGRQLKTYYDSEAAKIWK